MNIPAILEKRGFKLSTEQSTLSCSSYYHITHPNLDHEVTVRNSDHTAKPTYQMQHGAADFEIGDHQAATGRDWYAALDWLFAQADVEKPEWLTSTIEERKAAFQRRMKNEHQRIENRREKIAHYQTLIKANVNVDELEERLFATKELSNNAKKRRRPEIIRETFGACGFTQEEVDWRNFRTAMYRLTNFI